MIGPLALALIVFTLALSVLFPVILAVVLYRRRRISALAILVGALVFLVSQLLTRIPLLNQLGQTAWYQTLALTNPALLGLFLGVTAGLFEETGRWVGFRFFLKGRWQMKNGVAFGIGHGGFEAIFLTGLTYLNNLVIALMINSGQFDQVLAPQLGAAADQVRNALTQVPAYLFGVAGIERFLTIIVHIALSLVVLTGVRQRKPIFWLYAILLHTLLDAPIALFSTLPQAVLITEGYLFILAVAAFVYIRHVWKTCADE